MAIVNELPLKLARKCLEVVGTAPLFGGGASTSAGPLSGGVELEDEAGGGGVSVGAGSSSGAGPSVQGPSGSSGSNSVLARTIQTGWEEETASIAAGKDFALIRTASGKVSSTCFNSAEF
jgi:hypothetical protein